MTAPSPRRKAGLPLIAVLVAIASVSALSISVILPSLPAISDEMGTNAAGGQLILSTFLVALALGQPFAGPLADRLGRRPILFAGLALYVAGGLAAAFADSLAVLIAARVAQGIGAGVGVTVSRAIIRDMFDRARAASVLGYVTAGLAVTPMIGPAIGGALNDVVGWRFTFVAIALTGAATIVAIRAILPETLSPDHARRPTIARDIGQLLALPEFWAYALTAALISGTYFAFIAGAPFIATELIGLSATELGAWLFFVSFGYFGGNFLSGRLSVRMGITFMIHAGNTIVVATLATMLGFMWAGVLNPWTLFVPVALLGLGNGISLPSAIAGGVSVRPDLAGTAAGIAGSIQFAVGACASVIGGMAISSLEAASATSLVAIMAAFGLGAMMTGIWSQLGRREAPIPQ